MRSRSLSRVVLAALSTVCLAGCGGTPSQTCTVTIDITPVTATLDHTKSGNSRLYETNVIVPPGCPLPPLPGPVWSVSNTVAASITQSGVASCKAASTSPITVTAGKTYGTATLICD